MNRNKMNEKGFTVVELIVAMGLLSAVAVGFYSVMLSGVRGNDTARSVATVSQEARLGINRMLRDTREARAVTSATSTAYTIEVDFDGNGQMPDPASSPNPAGDYEVLTYSFDAAQEAILLNGEVLIDGVSAASTDVFSYSSNLLEYDADGDGTTTMAELEAADQQGASLLPNKNAYISDIGFDFRVTSGDRATVFSSEAQLRNRR